MCCCSLRLSTHFWVFTHIFFGAVLITVIGYEALFFDFDSVNAKVPRVKTEQIFSIYELIPLWIYAATYLALGMLILCGVHMEYLRLMKWTSIVFFFVQCGTIGLIICKLNTDYDISKKIDPSVNPFIWLFNAMTHNIILFFFLLELMLTYFYLVCLILFTWRLSQSKVEIQRVNYA